MSVLYRKKKNSNYLFWTRFHINLLTNIVVERIPCCIWTSNGLALTLLMVYIIGWERIKVDLPMNREMLWFLNIYIFFRRNLRNHAPFFPSYNEKNAVGWIQPILEINNSHTLPFQKKSTHQALRLDLLDLLLKYRY